MKSAYWYHCKFTMEGSTDELLAWKAEGDAGERFATPITLPRSHRLSITANGDRAHRWCFWSLRHC